MSFSKYIKKLFVPKKSSEADDKILDLNVQFTQEKKEQVKENFVLDLKKLDVASLQALTSQKHHDKVWFSLKEIIDISENPNIIQINMVYGANDEPRLILESMKYNPERNTYSVPRAYTSLSIEQNNFSIKDINYIINII